jgi:hypothetical protein
MRKKSSEAKNGKLLYNTMKLLKDFYLLVQDIKTSFGTCGIILSAQP